MGLMQLTSKQTKNERAKESERDIEKEYGKSFSVIANQKSICDASMHYG